MISEQQLRNIFESNDYLRNKMPIFFKKRLNTLFKKGMSNNIISIIKVLEKYNLLNLIIECPSILAQGKVSEIKKIIEELKIQENLLDNCPSILTQGKASEIKKIIEELKNIGKFNLLDNCPYILAQGKTSEIKKIIDELKSIEKINLLDKCPTILAQGKASEIKKIIDELKNIEKLNLLDKCPTILAQSKIPEIKKIIEELKNIGKFNLLDKCPYILAKGKALEIKKIIEELKNIEKLNLLDSSPHILAEGKSSEIKKIIDELKSIGKFNLLDNCPSILAEGKSLEIKKIIGELKNIGKFNLLDNCPYILAQGKASEIKKIIEELKNIGKINLLDKCPTILAKGKTSEIKKIIEELKNADKLDLLDFCPYILARGKASEIKNIFKLIDSIDGQIENIGATNLLYYKKVKSIIELNPDDKDLHKNCVLYLKLKGIYNRILTKKEIITLAELMNLKYEEFLENIWSNINIEPEILKEVLESQGYLFLGTCSIRSEDLNKYGELIEKIVTMISKKYYKQMKKDYSDVYDIFLDCVINKCGALFINLGLKLDILCGSLVNYLRKVIPANSNHSNISFDMLENSRRVSFEEDFEQEDKNFLVEYNYLSLENRIFLQRMSYYIETRGSYIEGLEKEFKMNFNEVQKKINELRELITEHQINTNMNKVHKLKRSD